MELTYAYFWPRARSHAYAEVKRIEAKGWVIGRASDRGARPSVTFSVTVKGRRALAAWLASPSEVFALEMEPLVRLYLSRFGDDEALAGALGHARAQAEGMLEIAREIVPLYLQGTPPPPADRLRDRVLLIDFLTRFAFFVRDWSERSASASASWAKLDDEEIDRRAMKALRHLAAELSRA